MPIYSITTKGEDAVRLVKAESAAQALRHVSRDKFTAKTISNAETLADLMAGDNGLKVETAGEEPPEPEGKDGQKSE